MFTHKEIWDAIDALGRAKGWSASRLAVRAGLDPTALNLSKRLSSDGAPRWPSTRTLSLLLSATGTPLQQFCQSIQAPAPANAHRRILLVDDDASFRETAAKGLRDAGYLVHHAPDHRIAFDILDDGADIDLLCTDIVMPDGLGGLALARRARARRPSLKVVYVTAFPTEQLAARALGPLLRKPVGSDVLVATIERLCGLPRDRSPAP